MKAQHSTADERHWRRVWEHDLCGRKWCREFQCLEQGLDQAFPGTFLVSLKHQMMLVWYADVTNKASCSNSKPGAFHFLLLDGASAACNRCTTCAGQVCTCICWTASAGCVTLVENVTQRASEGVLKVEAARVSLMHARDSAAGCGITKCFSDAKFKSAFETNFRSHERSSSTFERSRWYMNLQQCWEQKCNLHRQYSVTQIAPCCFKIS